MQLVNCEKTEPVAQRQLCHKIRAGCYLNRIARTAGKLLNYPRL